MFKVQEIIGSDMKKLLPDRKNIPEEFWRWGNRYCRVVMLWYFCGIKNRKFVPRRGVNTFHAINHLKAILVSEEPDFDHKIAGCAYLISQWFDHF